MWLLKLLLFLSSVLRAFVISVDTCTTGRDKTACLGKCFTTDTYMTTDEYISQALIS